MYDPQGPLSRLSFEDMAAHLLTQTPPSSLCNLKVIICYRLVIQLASACNERGFSRLKLIKNDLRTSMHNDLLDWLLLLSIEGPALSETEAVRSLCERALQR